MRDRRLIKIQFIHGLESSPQGRKAKVLSEVFTTCVPSMDTNDFMGCIEIHAKAIISFQPDILIGSSFGGAIAVELLRRGDWRGPTLLLAQAAFKFNPDTRLPEGVPIVIVHGSHDQVIDIEDSRALSRTGSPDRVHFIEVDDNHELKKLVDSGQLVALVEQMADQKGKGQQQPL